MTRVLICGVSTRAAAESAARAGFAVTAIDGYADRDQHPGVRALSMPRDFGTPWSASAAARIAREIECDAVAYSSNFENHARAVSALAAGRPRWGNSPAVLRRSRDPIVVTDEFRRRGFPAPAVRRPGSALEVSQRTPGVTWLLKPRASGGGHGIREWREGDAIPRGHYLQQQIAGIPGSIVFVATEGRAIPLGVSRQLVGDAAFGASGYRYCGSILDADDAVFGAEARVFSRACALAEAAAEAFDLVGVNGIDFVASDDDAYPIEINPRWSSSMELVERSSGTSVFAAHAAACAGDLSPSNSAASHFAGALGKAIVFARRDVTIGDTRAWLDDPDVRDVPHSGDRIRAGRPVCTVFASAASASACHAALVERAAHVYAQLDRWRQEAA